MSFPGKLKAIGKGAFSGCALTQITLPEGLKTIGAEAFSGNAALNCVRLPASLLSIGDKAFSGGFYRSESKETALHFGGTLAQWKAVLKAPAWADGSGIRTVHCADGDETVS